MNFDNLNLSSLKLGNNLGNGYGITDIENQIKGVTNSIPKPSFDAFQKSTVVSGTRDFLNSNSSVAKVVFLLLVVIVFMILFRLGTSLIGYLFQIENDPYLVKGMKSAKKMKTVQQNPKISGSVPILRSKNGRHGMEFTWSVWMFVDDMTYKSGEYRHVFHKGNDDIIGTHEDSQRAGLNHPNNAPGLYIAPDTNDLVVIMNTFNEIQEEVVVKDFPMNKWFNVIIRLENKTIDVYVNGTLTKRHVLSGVPKQNYGNVFVNMNGGYSGYLSNLRYFDNAIPISKVQSIISGGPNQTMDDRGKDAPPYLSERWYLYSQ
jgi:hypothetical protein